MGIDLSAAIGHSLSLPELVSLPLTLDSRPALRETLLAIDRGRARSFWRKLFFRLPPLALEWHWWDKEFERNSVTMSERIWDEGWGLLLEGPFTGVWIYRHVCELSYHVRWGHFLTDDTTARAMRVVCHELVSAFNPQSGAKQRAIYFPDKAAVDGREGNLDDVLKAMQACFGPPAKSIREIYDVDEHGS